MEAPPKKNEFKTTLPFGSSLNGERELFKGLDETKSTAYTAREIKLNLLRELEKHNEK